MSPLGQILLAVIAFTGIPVGLYLGFWLLLKTFDGMDWLERNTTSGEKRAIKRRAKQDEQRRLGNW